MRHDAPGQAEPHEPLIACHDCDLLYPMPSIRKGEKAFCPRCGALVLERKSHGIDYTLALALACLVFFVEANFNTLLSMNISGRVQTGSIFSGVRELYLQGYWEIAVLVFVVSILAPLVKILCLCYVLLPMKLKFRLPKSIQVFKYYEILHPWAMTEVYMLGILVAIVKLGDLATIEFGLAFYSFVALMIFIAATDASLDDHEVWERLEASP